MFEPLSQALVHGSVLQVVLAYVLCYLICGIPFGLIFSKLFKKTKDLRQTGSGNIGFTNALRVNGKTVGVLTLIFDVLKAFISIKLTAYILSGALHIERAELLGAPYIWVLALAFVCCIVGHVFSIYLKFKGGKGVAVGLGSTLAFIPVTGLLMLAVFFVAAYVSKKVSVGSIFAALATIPFCFIYSHEIKYVLLCCLIAVIVVWAHRSNIKRILNGTESSFSLHKQKE